MISPTNHDSCRFLFCIFELFLSHFNAQLNHFPSVDAMLHRCKALPEALLSRTCTVLGSADCSCEVVQSQSWSRVIVVSVAIEFSVVPFFLLFFQQFFDNCSTEWKIDLCPWQVKHPAGPSWPTTLHSHGSQSWLVSSILGYRLGVYTPPVMYWLQRSSVFSIRWRVLTIAPLGNFGWIKDVRVCCFFFSVQLLTPGRPYVGPTSPLTGVWSQTWGFLTFGLKVAKNKPNLPQVGLEKDAKASLYVMRNIERNRKTSTCARRFRRQNCLSQGAALSAEWMCFVWNRGKFWSTPPFWR